MLYIESLVGATRSFLGLGQHLRLLTVLLIRIFKFCFANTSTLNIAIFFPTLLEISKFLLRPSPLSNIQITKCYEFDYVPFQNGTKYCDVEISEKKRQKQQ